MTAMAIVLRRANFARIRRKEHARVIAGSNRLLAFMCRMYGRRLMTEIPDLRFHMSLCDRLDAAGSPPSDVAHIRGGILGRAARASKSLGVA